MERTVCFSKLELVLICVFILHEMPVIGYFFPSVVFALIVVVLTFSLINKMPRNGFYALLSLFLIPVLRFVIHLFDSFNLVSILQELSGFMQLILLTLVAYLLVYYKDTKQAKLILSLFAITNFITCLTTIQGCELYPGASRFLATGDETVVENFGLFKMANIGGFSFVYTMVLMIPLFIYTIRNRTKFHKMIPLMSILGLFVMFYLAIRTEYTTALVVSMLMLALFFIRQESVEIKRIFVTVAIVLSLGSLVTPYISQGLMQIALTTESRSMSDRLTDLSLKIEGKESESHEADLDDRVERTDKSINTFLSNPLGTWSDKYGHGGHSYLFDNMAIFGILGLVCMLIMLRRIFILYLLPHRGSSHYLYLIGMYVAFCVLLVVNTGAFYTPITFVFPLFLLVFNK